MSKPEIKDFTGLDILKIDVANTYGLDKETFEDRIKWFDDNMFIGIEGEYPIDSIHAMMKDASEPLLFKKASIAYLEGVKGNPIKHNVFMDATASGLQIMACLSNCKSSGELTNLVYNGRRNDPYTAVTKEMLKRLPNSPMFKDIDFSEARKVVKVPIMTHFYNSTANPKLIFGEDTKELEVFYQVLEELFPGPTAVMEIINESWDPNTEFHSWTLPDGHVANVPVIDQVHTQIEVDELDMKFNYLFKANQPSDRNTSLAPNIIG